MCALDGTRIDSSRRVAVVGARERPFSVKRICWLKGFAGCENARTILWGRLHGRFFGGDSMGDSIGATP